MCYRTIVPYFITFSSARQSSDQVQLSRFSASMMLGPLFSIKCPFKKKRGGSINPCPPLSVERLLRVFLWPTPSLASVALLFTGLNRSGRTISHQPRATVWYGHSKSGKPCLATGYQKYRSRARRLHGVVQRLPPQP